MGLGDGTTHGNDGPIDISSGKYVGATLQKDFLAAFSQVGYPSAPDIQDLKTSNDTSACYRIVSPTTGRRQDTAYTYLYPRLQQHNDKRLSVLVNTRVCRVLFDKENRATGVQIQSKSTCSQQQDGSTPIVKARKLVILSAGAFGSPQILEMSGIGDKDILEQAGVSVVSSLPGVGRDYQNHQMILASYRADLTAKENVDSVFNGVLNATQLIQEDADILSWNGVDASAKIRPTKKDIDAFNPALRKVWEEQYANEPTRPLGVIVVYAGYVDYEILFYYRGERTNSR